MKTADIVMLLGGIASAVVIWQFLRRPDVNSPAYALNPDNWLRIDGVPGGRYA